MRLDEVEWGDVLVDTGDVVVCQGLLGDDAVVVKRWRGGALDAELAARRRLAEAGVAGPDLLGWGGGWLVLEDIGETVWRPATEDDLASLPVARALARHMVAVHALSADGLPGDPAAALLAPPLLDLVASLIDPAAGSRLADAVRQWTDLVGETPATLVAGSFERAGLVVVGDGLRAALTDWTLAHAGHPAEDLVRVLDVLDEPAGEEFLAEYRSQAPSPAAHAQVLDAQRGLGDVAAVVADLAAGEVGAGGGAQGRLVRRLANHP